MFIKLKFNKLTVKLRYMTFGGKVRTLRENKGLSMREFSRKSGIPYDTIITIESRKERMLASPLLVTAIKIAKFFNISIDELVKEVRFE